MTPRHAVFREIFGLCQEIGATFDYLPEAGTSYPFFFLGDAETRLLGSSDLLANVSQRVHIYGERRQRSLLDDWVAKFQSALKRAEGKYGYHLVCRLVEEKTFPDHTDVVPLLHVVLEVNIQATKKERNLDNG